MLVYFVEFFFIGYLAMPNRELRKSEIAYEVVTMGPDESLKYLQPSVNS